MRNSSISPKRKICIGLARLLTLLSAALTCGLTLFLIGYVLISGLPHVTWSFLTTSPSVLSGQIGILPDIMNTLYIILATLLLVLPLGVGAAVYLNEYATNKKLVGVIE